MTSFKPEYAGKMNFYLSGVDDILGTVLRAARTSFTVATAPTSVARIVLTHDK